MAEGATVDSEATPAMKKGAPPRVGCAEPALDVTVVAGGATMEEGSMTARIDEMFTLSATATRATMAVSIAWLDADLQARLGGASAPVSTRQALADMDQKIRALSDQVGRLQTIVATSQKVLDDAQEIRKRRLSALDRGLVLLDRLVGINVHVGGELLEDRQVLLHLGDR